MDLCLAFGQWDIEAFLDEIPHDVLNDWVEYTLTRGLPSHLPRQFASFMPQYLAAHGVKGGKAEDYMLIREVPTKAPNLAQKIRASLGMIASAMKAKNGSS